MRESKSDVATLDRRLVLKGAAAAVPAATIAVPALAADPQLIELCAKHASISKACLAARRSQDASHDAFTDEIIDRWEKSGGIREGKSHLDIFFEAMRATKSEKDSIYEKHRVSELDKKRKVLIAAHNELIDQISEFRARSFHDVEQKLQAAARADKAGHLVDRQLAKLVLSLSVDFQEIGIMPEWQV